MDTTVCIITPRVSLPRLCQEWSRITSHTYLAHSPSGTDTQAVMIVSRHQTGWRVPHLIFVSSSAFIYRRCSPEPYCITLHVSNRALIEKIHPWLPILFYFFPSSREFIARLVL